MKKVGERIKLKGIERAAELDLNDMKTLLLYIWMCKTSALRP